MAAQLLGKTVHGLYLQSIIAALSIGSSLCTIQQDEHCLFKGYNSNRVTKRNIAHSIESPKRMKSAAPDAKQKKKCESKIHALR